MARVNVYLPDELADQARAARLNVSNVAQEALRRELAGLETSAWVAGVLALPALEVSHDKVLESPRRRTPRAGLTR
jgi:post-segregation antitoxin (ccd killing protein)